MINGSNGHVNDMGKYEQLKKNVKIKIDKISKYGLEKKISNMGSMDKYSLNIQYLI